MGRWKGSRGFLPQSSGPTVRETQHWLSILMIWIWWNSWAEVKAFLYISDWNKKNFSSTYHRLSQISKPQNNSLIVCNAWTTELACEAKSLLACGVTVHAVAAIKEKESNVNLAINSEVMAGMPPFKHWRGWKKVPQLQKIYNGKYDEWLFLFALNFNPDVKAARVYIDCKKFYSPKHEFRLAAISNRSKGWNFMTFFKSIFCLP